MREQTDSQAHGDGKPPVVQGDGRKDYEPPRLTVFGTVAELTRQQLKQSGTADLVNFQS